MRTWKLRYNQKILKYYDPDAYRRLIAELERASIESIPFVEDLQIWRVTSAFGWRRHPITGRETLHNGIDIIRIPHGSTDGRKLIAPIDGYIVRNTSRIGGYQSIVFNDYLRFGFAHLRRQESHEARKVRIGEEVGRVDNSGRSTGPHLHLTMAVWGRHPAYNEDMWILIDPVDGIEALWGLVIRPSTILALEPHDEDFIELA